MNAGKYSGTSGTTKSLLVDAAVVYLNYGELTERKLGATRGGASFKVEQELKDIEVDGARGPVKGNRRITNVKPSITAELLEITQDNLVLAFPGAVKTLSSDSKTYTISRDTTLEETAYFDNVALVGTISGSDDPVVIIIKNVLAEGDFELGTEDKDESTVPITFIGHFDPVAISAGDNTEPWEIRYPNMDQASDTVDLLAIPGITVPVTGATPDTAIDTNDQYTATVVWAPADAAFLADTTYMATITLTPKAGYTLAGVASNSFTVAGAILTSNEDNAGIVRAVFPATA